MSLVDFVLYLLIGRLLTWLLQTAGLMRPVWQLHELAQELSECDLCLGFWVYLGLALGQEERPLGRWPWLFEVVILAAGASVMAHLLKIGWIDKFGTVIV